MAMPGVELSPEVFFEVLRKYCIFGYTDSPCPLGVPQLGSERHGGNPGMPTGPHLYIQVWDA